MFLQYLYVELLFDTRLLRGKDSEVFCYGLVKRRQLGHWMYWSGSWTAWEPVMHETEEKLRCVGRRMCRFEWKTAFLPLGFICLGFSRTNREPIQSRSVTLRAVLDNYSMETGPLWCPQGVSQYRIVRLNVYISWTSSTLLTTFRLTNGLCMQYLSSCQHCEFLHRVWDIFSVDGML